MERKIIAIFTTTRAEFGILLSFIREIQNDKIFDYRLFVGGAHLTQEYGLTLKEIQKAGVIITDTFDYLLNEDSKSALTRSMGVAFFRLSEIFSKEQFDYVCLLGDRYELLAIALSSILFNKPIIHISGGESTEGAIDEQVRHMLTKAAHIHFTYTDEYAENIIKMGEERWRVFNTGALGADNLVQYPSVSKQQLFNELGLNPIKKTVLLTYHPVSFEFLITPVEQIKNIFDSLKDLDLQVVITAPNAEENRQVLYDFIITATKEDPAYHFYDSLGEYYYNNLVPFCSFVIGNSSSGITYVPYFKVPSINIGTRQKGRIRHESIIDVDYNIENIKQAIKLALSETFLKKIGKMKYKFGGGNAAKLMLEAIKNIPSNEILLCKKLTF